MLDRDLIQSYLTALPTLEAQMADPVVTADRRRYGEVLREHTRLKKIETAAMRFFGLQQEIEAAKEMLADPDMAEMAQEELPLLEAQLP
ncbi:MAG: PCRF domain-containing protein, partial [Kiritimatiellae bacterium]|nr:PCRF domain-containing protein [Kiritimatiellia bacterium]